MIGGESHLSSMDASIFGLSTRYPTVFDLVPEGPGSYASGACFMGPVGAFRARRFAWHDLENISTITKSSQPPLRGGENATNSCRIA